jgi:hypothetical protein
MQAPHEVDAVRSAGHMRITLVTVVAAILATSTVAAQPAACDRPCLEAMLDGYLGALVSHDPKRLPADGRVKFTENGQRLELGDGVWRTITGKGSYALRIADVERGQAVLMGTIREADTPAIFILRLKVDARRMTEVETLVIRNQMAAESLDRIREPRRTFFEAVPAAARLSRAELVRIANSYFSGIERNDGKGSYPIHETCARLENGAVTAGDPALVLGAAGASALPARPRTGCLEQFKSGVFFYVTRVRDRRFVAVDTERGLAFAFAFFDNGSGDARQGTLADGRRVTSGPSIPWTWQIAEVFKIEGGLIGPVESVLHAVPYGMDSGWSTYEEAMSSQPRW